MSGKEPVYRRASVDIEPLPTHERIGLVEARSTLDRLSKEVHRVDQIPAAPERPPQVSREVLEETARVLRLLILRVEWSERMIEAQGEALQKEA